MVIQNPKGINLSKQNSMKTILFAESGDGLQRLVTLLNETVKQCMKTSPEKTKSMTMQYSRRAKTGFLCVPHDDEIFLL